MAHRLHEMLPKSTKENIVELTSPSPGQPKSYIDLVKQMNNQPYETVPIEEVCFHKTEPKVTSRRIKAFPSAGHAKNTTRGFDADILTYDLGPEYEAILSMTLKEREKLFATLLEKAGELQQRIKDNDKHVAEIDRELIELQRVKDTDLVIDEVDFNKRN